MRDRLVRALVYTHRWLGIAGCVLFIAWFVSGIVLMYARMPELGDGERLAHLRPLDLSTVRVSPAEAAERLTGRPRAVRLAMLDSRPVYRFEVGRTSAAVYADTGEALPPIDDALALLVARALVPVNRRLYWAGLLAAPDQLTLEGSLRRRLPLHRGAGDDAQATMIYVSTTGEAVLKTTWASRTLGFSGAVVHWLYFTPIRRNGAFWNNLVVWLSIAGIVMCLSGLAWGLWRISPRSRFRLRREPSHTPYSGMMRWHHYAGLMFGLTTFTWIFSGLLSMDPWDWHPGNSPTVDQRMAATGGPLRLDEVTAEQLRTAAGVLAGRVGAREVEIVQFRGKPILRAYQPPAGEVAGPLPQQMVSIDSPEGGAFERFDADLMMRSALEAMPDQMVEDAAWLDRYDAYYYDRHGERPLPVLRVRFQDPVRTWLYLDPRAGAVVLKEERMSRVNRWLYHGLHSLDFPWLYNQRPLWDVVVIVLSLGGIASAVTAVSPGWCRLRRLATSFRRRSPVPRS